MQQPQRKGKGTHSAIKKIEKTAFLRSVNSYLGIMQHYKMYNFKSKLIKHCCGIYWKNYFSFKTSLKKIVWLKTEYID